MLDLPATSRFETTSWGLILAAGEGGTPDAEAALAALCRTYWPPVYAFVRRHGYDPQSAQDLTQGFFSLVIEKHYLRSADPERGRFRTFLLTAVRHFLANEWDRSQAAKRGGRVLVVSMDDVETAGTDSIAISDRATPEALYQRGWALALLDRVMRRLREDFERSDKGPRFNLLAGHLSRDSRETPYDDLAQQLGISAGALRVTVHRMRRRYRELLREEIGATVNSPEEVESEIRFLMATLSEQP